MNQESRFILFAFINELRSVDEFQSFIYENPSIRSEFGDDLYDYLLRASYHSSSELQDLRSALNSFYRRRWPRELETLEVIMVCDQVLMHAISPVAGCRQLARLSTLYSDLVPGVFWALEEQISAAQFFGTFEDIRGGIEETITREITSLLQCIR